MTVQVGKRYSCTVCGAVVVGVRASEVGHFVCCGKPMEVLAPAQLPSSD
jgi:desulfoferrodoxin-like iron-binding protein